MNPGINFNRPALIAAQLETRRRTLRVSLGVGYLMLLTVLGSYLIVEGVLVKHSLRVAQNGVGGARGIDRETQQVLQVDPAFLDLMRQLSSTDKCWAPKLKRLVTLLPSNAWIVKLDAGTSNTPLGDPKRRRMGVTVSAAVRGEEEKILFPMRFVQALQRDSLFADGYSDIHFSATKVLTGTEATVVNFEVECR